MADPRVRRERLLSLLPRIFTSQPESSALGRVIDGMATSLARMDEALTRVQYDRWVGLASHHPPSADDISALEGLGQLLQVTRLPARIRHGGYERSPEGIEVRFSPVAPLAEALDELIGSGWRQSDPLGLLEACFSGLRFTLADAS
jgi:hypothetical protein